MAKKLLNEAQVRRFAKLAKLSPINEMYENTEEEVMQEEAMEDIAVDAEEEVPAELEGPIDAEAGIEDELGAEDGIEGESDLELSQDMVDAIAAALPALQMIADAAGEEAPMEDPMEDPVVDELPAEEPPVDLGEPSGEPEEEEVMEALKGINYIPEQKDVVQEVARRVARRLLKAKKAEQSLKEALGSKKK